MASRGCPNCGYGGSGHQSRGTGRRIISHGKSSWKMWLVIGAIIFFWAQGQGDDGTGSSRTPQDPKPPASQSQCDPGALFDLC